MRIAHSAEIAQLFMIFLGTKKMSKKLRNRLSLILFSGDYDRVHYALAIASAAASTNRPVTLFLAGGGLKLILADIDKTPGWSQLRASENGKSPLEQDRENCENGIGTINELLGACIHLDVTFYHCDMAVSATGLADKKFREDIPIKSGGLVSFLSETEKEGSQIVFI